MGEDIVKKIEGMSKILVRIKELERENRNVIEKMTNVQFEFENLSMKLFADKISQIFSTDSKNEDLLKEVIKELEIEINQLKNKLPKTPPPEK